MQISKIVDPLNQLSVQQNILLHDALSEVNAGERASKIAGLIFKYMWKGKTQEALDMLSLLWPAILYKHLSTGLVSEDMSGISFRLKLTDLSEDEQKALDLALQTYADHMSQIILRLINEKNFSIEMVRLAACELLSAGHLMMSRTLANKCFSLFAGAIAGHYPNVINCGLMEKAPEILRMSLCNVPERNYLVLGGNILTYAQVIKNRLANESSAKQCEILGKMVTVLAKSLCHYSDPHATLDVLLAVAEKAGLAKVTT